MRPLRRVTLTSLACLLLLSATANATRAATPVRVAVYTHSGEQAGTVRTLRRVLGEADGFQAKPITPQAIRRGDLNQYDVLIMPGGSASKQANMLGAQGRESIRQFVQNGGGYVGICAGSYLATPHYSWSMGLLNAQVVDRQHWARGTGKVSLRLSAAGTRALDEKADRVSVYYGQGPLLAPGHYSGLPAYESLATYATAIAKRSGARPEVMLGTTAIARGTFGKGRVFCFSPHPEASGGPNHFIRAGVRWAASREQKVSQVSAVSRSLPADAPAQVITPPGERLARALDGLDVEHRWLPGVRVHWRTGEPTQPRQRAATHCSAFVAAACDRLGVYILRPPEHSQVLLANAQQKWLLGQGRQQGWREVRSWQEAQRLANQGVVVVASYRNANPKKPGHVALVRPSSKSMKTVAAEGPDVIWAGRHNRNQGSLLEGFKTHPSDAIRFFAHQPANGSS